MPAAGRVNFIPLPFGGRIFGIAEWSVLGVLAKKLPGMFHGGLRDVGPADHAGQFGSTFFGGE